MAETQSERIHEREEAGPGSRSTSEVVRELVLESSALIHAEVALARTEVKENLAGVTNAVAAAAAGAAVLAAGLLTLLAAVVLALAIAWPAWLAALIAGGAVTITGAMLLAGGLARARPAERLRPSRTVQSIRRAPEVAPHRQERGG